MNTTKKLMKGILIAILLVIIIAGGLFVYSERVNKIALVENVKQRINAMVEEVLTDVEEANTTESKLKLHTEVDLTAANGRGGVQLSWEGIDRTDTIFKAFQKTEDSDEWQSISTAILDSHIEPIKVLHIYTGQNFLKTWMETEGYGKNPMTGEQALYITPVSESNFIKNPSMIWDYDITMIGGAGCTSGAIIDEEALKVLEEYIKIGYGVVLGHDPIGYEHDGQGIDSLRKYFNIETGHYSGYASSPNIDYYLPIVCDNDSVEVVREGLITNFPYNIPLGSTFSIPGTHVCGTAAKGKVWMRMSDANPEVNHKAYFDARRNWKSLFLFNNIQQYRIYTNSWFNVRFNRWGEKGSFKYIILFKTGNRSRCKYRPFCTRSKSTRSTYYKCRRSTR